MFFDQSLTRCPECHLNTLRHIPQLPAVIIKGTGWYSIDHRPPTNQKINSVTKKNGKTGITSGKEDKR
jgi:predicted nucleic acid-binding Zn ribbon protein